MERQAISVRWCFFLDLGKEHIEWEKEEKL